MPRMYGACFMHIPVIKRKERSIHLVFIMTKNRSVFFLLPMIIVKCVMIQKHLRLPRITISSGES